MLPWLKAYPNRPMADLLTDGFTQGFFVPEFTGSGCTWVENLKSVNISKDIVQAKLVKELVDGRIAVPFPHPPF